MTTPKISQLQTATKKLYKKSQNHTKCFKKTDGHSSKSNTMNHIIV